MNKNKLFYLLVAGLIIIPATPAFAEEAPADPVVEQPASDPTPEPSPEPAPEPAPEPRPTPPPAPAPAPVPEPKQAPEDIGTYSVVDSTGKVVNAIICQQSKCGDGGEIKGEMLCKGCSLHFQQPGHAGYRDSSDQGGPSVTYDRGTDTHIIKSQGLREDGSEYGTTIKMRNGQTLSASDRSIFRETTSDGKSVEAEVNVYSVRQLSDQGAEANLVEFDADVTISGENINETLEYANTQDLIDYLPSEAEQIIAEDTQQLIPTSVRESVMNVVNKIVSFFSSLIGGNNV